MVSIDAKFCVRRNRVAIGDNARIGGYELLSRLGSGGMGEVYLANGVLISWTNRTSDPLKIEEVLLRLTRLLEDFTEGFDTVAILTAKRLLAAHAG